MFSFIVVMLITWGCMWLFFKFMYPKPPKAFMPQKGDIITPRVCDYCGYSLAEYRGIVEYKPSLITTDKLEVANGVDDSHVSHISQDSKVGDEDRSSQHDKPQPQVQQIDEQKRADKLANSWFFCNAEHQAKFHADDNYTR